MSNSKIFVLAIFIVATSTVQCSPRAFTVRVSDASPCATSIPIINKHLRTSTIERLPLRTTGCIPRPKTIDHVCTCYKTIVKPQVNNHIITVPSVQRIIQTTAAPVIEKIHYEATPVDQSSVIPATTLSGLNTIPASAISSLSSIPATALSGFNSIPATALSGLNSLTGLNKLSISGLPSVVSVPSCFLTPKTIVL